MCTLHLPLLTVQVQPLESLFQLTTHNVRDDDQGLVIRAPYVGWPVPMGVGEMKLMSSCSMGFEVVGRAEQGVCA